MSQIVRHRPDAGQYGNEVWLRVGEREFDDLRWGRRLDKGLVWDLDEFLVNHVGHTQLLGVQLFGAQHVAALGDSRTAGETAENASANFWSVGAATVIK